MKKIIVLVCAVSVCVAQYGSSSRGGGYQAARGYQSGYQSNQGGSFGGLRNTGRSQGYSNAGYGGSRGYSQGGNQYGRQGSESEPAKYEFQYDVNVPEDYLEFGHKEQRDGDNTQGAYYVLLPDGRKQLVEYTADATGYHPRISYTEASGAGGYGSSGRNYQGGSGGYERSQSGYQGGSGGYGRSQSGYQGRSQSSGYQGSRNQGGYQGGRNQGAY